MRLAVRCPPLEPNICALTRWRRGGAKCWFQSGNAPVIPKQAVELDLTEGGEYYFTCKVIEPVGVARAVYLPRIELQQVASDTFWDGTSELIRGGYHPPCRKTGH